MHADLESIVCKFGGDPTISLEKKRFAQKFTDDGRRAIALAHSWNELKMDLCNAFRLKDASNSLA